MARSSNSGFARLYRGETTVNFYARRRLSVIVSGVLMIVTLGALLVNGLNLGIDFRGGVAWEAPVSGDLDLEQARAIVAEQELGDDVRIQTGDQPDTVRVAMQEALASSAGVDAELVSVAQVSSSWGRSITEKAIPSVWAQSGRDV